MKTMKVAMYYNNHDVRIQEMAIPTINENELLVKVIASGICGSDVMEWYRIKKAPRVLGHEISGEISKIGKNVKQYKVGDRVFISHHVPCNTCHYCKNDQHTLCHTLHSTNFDPGGFAQYLRVPEINVKYGTFVLPNSISYREGVFIEPLACVLRGLRIANFQKGQTVAIIGSGMSGLLHIKLVKAWQASRIFATDINEYRLQTAMKVGATHVIHASKDIPKEIKKNNKGNLTDLVILCTGNPVAARQCLDVVAPGGTILFFAPTEPGVDIPFPLFDLWQKGITLVTTYAGAPNDLKEAIDIISSKKISVTDLISHTLPLEKTVEGFALVTQAQESLKVIIEPQQ